MLLFSQLIASLRYWRFWFSCEVLISSHLISSHLMVNISIFLSLKLPIFPMFRNTFFCNEMHLTLVGVLPRYCCNIIDYPSRNMMLWQSLVLNKRFEQWRKEHAQEKWGGGIGIEKKHVRQYSRRKEFQNNVFIHGHYFVSLRHGNEWVMSCNSTFVYSNVYLNISLYLNK